MDSKGAEDNPISGTFGAMDEGKGSFSTHKPSTKTPSLCVVIFSFSYFPLEKLEEEVKLMIFYFTQVMSKENN